MARRGRASVQPDFYSARGRPFATDSSTLASDAASTSRSMLHRRFRRLRWLRKNTDIYKFTSALLSPCLKGNRHKTLMSKLRRNVHLQTYAGFLAVYRNRGQLSDLAVNREASRGLRASLRYGKFSDA
ncbi:hypothetical protein D3C76_692980 [compost metagenome]